jgi:hypothetical protein
MDSQERENLSGRRTMVCPCGWRLGGIIRECPGGPSTSNMAMREPRPGVLTVIFKLTRHAAGQKHLTKTALLAPTGGSRPRRQPSYRSYPQPDTTAHRGPMNQQPGWEGHWFPLILLAPILFPRRLSFVKTPTVT